MENFYIQCNGRMTRKAEPSMFLVDTVILNKTSPLVSVPFCHAKVIPAGQVIVTISTLYFEKPLEDKQVGKKQ